jgi:hypothetical protein
MVVALLGPAANALEIGYEQPVQTQFSTQSVGLLLGPVGSSVDVETTYS